MSDLDLETGDEARASRIAEEGAARSRRVREAGGKKASSKSSSSRSRRGAGLTDEGIRDRLVKAIEKIADQREVRGDAELADALKEDAAAMAQGIVSLTKSVTPLRGPIVVLLGFLEPLLAFWHVGGILGRRFIERRQRIAAERAAAAGETVVGAATL